MVCVVMLGQKLKGLYLSPVFCMRSMTVLMLYLLSIANSNAQTFSVKDLIGTKWKHIKDYKSNTKAVIEFTDTEMIETITFINKGEAIRCPRPYYLSPTVPTSFNRSLVGKTTMGIYLVMLYKFDRMDYKTIKKITPDSLVLYHRKTNAIGGHAQTFVYKRIK